MSVSIEPKRHLLFRLLPAFPPRRKRQFFLVLVLMLAGALAELVSIAAVLPFLQLAADPGAIGRWPAAESVIGLLGTRDPSRLIVISALVLIGAALVSATIRIVLIGVVLKYTYLLAHDLGSAVYSRTIRQPYGFYVRHNSSEVLSGMEKVSVVANGVIAPFMQAVTSGVIAIAIIALLIAIDPFTALVAGSAMALLYVLIGLASRSRVLILSRRFSELWTARVKAIQESLGGIREIILDQSHAAFEQHFNAIDYESRMINAKLAFFSMSPRYAVECIGIVLIALLALYFTTQPGGILAAIPVLGALALGAQRLLPLLQNLNLSWTQYLASVGNIENIVALLEGPVLTSHPRAKDSPPAPFREQIELRDLGFSYGRGEPALHDLALVIPKGSRIGFVGATGSGKSTVIDLIMGLLAPTDGAILVDGVPLDDRNIENWQAQIAHVPQAIFLADQSVAANIAFGLPADEVDHERVTNAARRADISSFIEGLPDGYGTLIGERGIRLSGGQRQRLGIARALYKEATVLVLDEATSALDQETEEAVMKGIEALDRDLTLLVIAHRLSTIAFCDTVCRLDRGRIVQKGSYSEVVTGGSARPASRRARGR